jgi:peptidoglycan/xylan/chitin deacetylase (PgdA/CDA1 family)
VHAFLPAYLLTSSDWSHPGIVPSFLDAAVKLHREAALPCTLFVRGEMMEAYADDFRRARDDLGELGDFQQATYSALPLKTICLQGPREISVHHAGTLRQCRDDLARASDVMERVLGERPIGLAGPLGYYRGLSDRPDLLEIVSSLGIRFTRTFTRNARDAHPLAFETQPFPYAPQGFGHIVEIPGQGWPDNVLREEIGFEDVDAYVKQTKKDLDYVAAKGLTWSYAQQDWSALLPRNDMRGMREILDHATKSGFQVMTHRQFADGMRKLDA